MVFAHGKRKARIHTKGYNPTITLLYPTEYPGSAVKVYVVTCNQDIFRPLTTNVDFGLGLEQASLHMGILFLNTIEINALSFIAGTMRYTPNAACHIHNIQPLEIRNFRYNNR